ncbi:DUF3566 domain-containing protein [Mycolicibacterium holsaticum]|uniref:DUF3566 domain-containing protein n=1 Tax=Mycolicibacterium holsaticum TaxID=152142 RepID=UPI001C7D2658|nr:DUF3566 domain-containing protein [Mycolicibacterium holsaticum]MDA4108624.1 hypothetical protein [Mycolicibacterium holsaticum DSM 44478 = JCM 12374]QZA12650.1 DUF3566 domain-containing protein [Mycolicibacterium holsaticum DSM 44478 = JCM 12374]UNC09873.1 DUF3566 domain-containing protein [Mycolicibacterium holsaticum DSM 44478 = JCM 12374]
MSSPNEPGHPRAVDGLGGANGTGGPGHDGGALGAAASRPGVTDRGGTPPWQRGAATRAAGASHRPPEAPPRRRPVAGRGPNARGEAPEGQGDDDSAPAQHSPGPEARQPGADARPAAPDARQTTPDVRPAAPDARQTTPDVRPGGPETRQGRPEAYSSELPDLSAPTPRPAQRKPERPTAEPANRPAGPTSRIQVGARHHGTVRASMQIRRVDPWSTLKVSLVLSVVLFFVWMIAVAFLYLALGGMGVWSKLNSNVGDLLTSASGTSGGELVSSGTIFGGAALVGLVNIVLLTAMATVGAFVYNLTTDLVGGVEVTLADRD